MWFKELTGFEENSPMNVKEKLVLKGTELISKVNGRKFDCGILEVPTLSELRDAAPDLGQFNGKIQVSEVVGNVQDLHAKIENEGALFQAASQFNLLEMVGPHITPEHGVGIYEHDYTQGPACAISCGAGTIFRNYFIKLGNELGQTSSNQVDCLELIGKELKNEELDLWEMKNGYAMVNQSGLLHLNAVLSKVSKQSYEDLKSL